jgi:hypothetical protein
MRNHTMKAESLPPPPPPAPVPSFGFMRCKRGTFQFTISIAAGVDSGDSGDGRSSGRPIHDHDDNWHARLMRHLTRLFLEAGHLLLTAQFVKYALQFSAERQREIEKRQNQSYIEKSIWGRCGKGNFRRLHPMKYVSRHHAMGGPWASVDGASRCGG